MAENLFSISYKTYTEEEDLSFEPYIFRGKSVWIWESYTTQPTTWYAGRTDDGLSLMTLHDRCRKFLIDRKLPFECLEFAQRKIKEIIRGRFFRSTNKLPLTQYQLVLQQKVNANLDYFGLSTEIGFSRRFPKQEVSLDTLFTPKNLTTHVSPLRNELMFDAPEIIQQLSETTLPIQDFLGPISTEVLKSNNTLFELKSELTSFSEQVPVIPTKLIEDELKAKPQLVSKFVRPMFNEYIDKTITPKLTFQYHPFTFNIYPERLNPFQLLDTNSKCDSTILPIIIYSPPGNGKTEFLKQTQMENILVDTDYFRHDAKDASLALELLNDGKSLITNHVEWLGYFAIKFPILCILPQDPDVTVSRMFAKLSRRRDLETVTKWGHDIYDDLQKLDLFKDSQVKTILLKDTDYLSTIKDLIIREALRLRFSKTMLRVNDWKNLNNKLTIPNG